MCTGIEIAALSTVALGTAVSTVGAIQQAETASDIATYNADMEKFKAEDALKRGAIEEEKQISKTRQIRAQQEVVMAASGTDLTSGTNAAILEQTTKFGTMDALTIRSNAQREAWGYGAKAQSSLLEGAMEKQKGYFGAAGTLLGGAERAYGIYKGTK